MEKTIRLKKEITKAEERNYIPVYFDVEDDVERIDIRYSYPKFSETEKDNTLYCGDTCTVDLAVMAPGENFIGSSGSNRSHIWISPLGSAPGFAHCPIQRGRWEIILGAYEVPQNGATVEYEITLALKSRRLFKGDTHSHTLSSDGSGQIEDTVSLARQLGLDYVFLSDHNNYAQNEEIQHYNGITVVPGCEWTHYNGHALMLGQKRPFTRRYGTTTQQETIALMEEARERGAFISLAHPFCSWVPWLWGFEVPFDGLEVWNGVMSERNEKAIAYWHSLLVQGRRVPATSGSDYHRPGILLTLATPCLCVYAMSRQAEDILAAIRAGHSYISYLPSGPGLDVACKSKLGAPAQLGDAVPAGSEVEFSFTGLKGGDEIRLVTSTDAEKIVCEPGACEMRLARQHTGTPFVRAEVYRSYESGLPPMKALLSNPVYFE